MKFTDYWDEVVYQSNQQRERLGAFPPPKITTVAAAEILKLLLKKAGPNGGRYEGTMACSVVQLHDLFSKQQTFVVSFSGYHPHLRLNLKKGRDELIEAFKDLGLPVSPPPRFWYRQASPGYYVPLHAQTQDYFKKHLDDFDVSKGSIPYSAIQDYLSFDTWKNTVFEGKKKRLTDIREEQLTKKIPNRNPIRYKTYSAVYGQETGSFSYEYRGKAKRPRSKDLANMFKKKAQNVGKEFYTIGENFEQQKNDILKAICGMLAAFLAIRMDLIRNNDVPAAVKAGRGFIKQLKLTNMPRLIKLAAYLEQILIAPKLSREALDREVVMDRVKQKQMIRMRTPPQPRPDRFEQGERELLRKALNKRELSQVPQTRKIQPSDLVAGRNRLKPPPTGDLASKREELIDELQNDELFSDILPHLWAASGGGPNGQFCAEPKAFDHVRNGCLMEGGADSGKSRVVVAGQLAMWYSEGADPRNFSESLLIIGPDHKRNVPISGGYMLPCSSCAARSGVMMEGVSLKSDLKSNPELFVSKYSKLKRRCVMCGRTTNLVCGRCHAVYYCGKEHQRTDWGRHKSYCVPVRQQAQRK